jgi:transcriptional regulator with AAA-type ATPase domain/pSer/pThr/pTyr-binding forkhead associated (FHA) protein
MQKKDIAAELTIKKGNRIIQKFQLFNYDDVLTIGRHYSNNIRLSDDPKISRVHAAIVRYDPLKKDFNQEISKNEKPFFFIRDLGSAHGTKVGGKFTHKRLLNEGDVIRISKYNIIFGRTGSDESEAAGIPLDERYGKLTPQKVYEKETVLSPLQRKKTASEFSQEQEEFLSNMVTGGLSADFSDRPKEFMRHLLDLMNAEQGIFGCYSDSEIFIDDSCGLDREDPQCTVAFIKNLFKTGPIRQDAALWLPLPENNFLALFRIRPPAFNSDDLKFMSCVCDNLPVLESFEDNLYELTEWPTPMVGLSEIKKKARIIAQSEDTENNDVLILGESGTGKEVLARYIHRHSLRKDKPFKTESCAVLTKELVHSELFGHEKGAFSGAKDKRSGAFIDADFGVLFLDEIGELPNNIQSALLTAIQQREIKPLGSDKTKKVDLRILAATDRDLETGVLNETFRRALYERFTYSITVPPLRERKEEISLLAHYFLDKYSQQTRAISRDALECMRQYEWPGNIRELQRRIKDAVLLKKEIIFSWDLPPEIRAAKRIKQYKKKIQKTLKETEKERIMEVLEETRGNKILTAKILGISRATLYNKLTEHSIPQDLGRTKGR